MSELITSVSLKIAQTAAELIQILRSSSLDLERPFVLEIEEDASILASGKRDIRAFARLASYQFLASKVFHKDFKQVRETLRRWLAVNGTYEALFQRKILHEAHIKYSHRSSTPISDSYARSFDDHLRSILNQPWKTQETYDGGSFWSAVYLGAPSVQVQHSLLPLSSESPSTLEQIVSSVHVYDPLELRVSSPSKTLQERERLFKTLSSLFQGSDVEFHLVGDTPVAYVSWLAHKTPLNYLVWIDSDDHDEEAYPLNDILTFVPLQIEEKINLRNKNLNWFFNNAWVPDRPRELYHQWALFVKNNIEKQIQRLAQPSKLAISGARQIIPIHTHIKPFFLDQFCVLNTNNLNFFLGISPTTQRPFLPLPDSQVPPYLKQVISTSGQLLEGNILDWAEKIYLEDDENWVMLDQVNDDTLTFAKKLYLQMTQYKTFTPFVSEEEYTKLLTVALYNVKKAWSTAGYFSGLKSLNFLEETLRFGSRFDSPLPNRSPMMSHIDLKRKANGASVRLKVPQQNKFRMNRYPK